MELLLHCPLITTYTNTIRFVFFSTHAIYSVLNHPYLLKIFFKFPKNCFQILWAKKCILILSTKYIYPNIFICATWFTLLNILAFLYSTMLIPPEEEGNKKVLCVLKNLIQIPKANKGKELGEA